MANIIRPKRAASSSGYSPSFKEYFFGINSKKAIETAINPKAHSKSFSSLNSSDKSIKIIL